MADIALPIIGGVIDSIGDVAGAAITAQSTADINAQNLRFQREKLSYDKDLQDRFFAREDNAVQRRRADLEAAGLSPVLAAGSAAQAGPVVSTTAPHVGRVPDYGRIASAAGRAPGAILDVQSAVLRNQQQAANIAQSEAQTELIRQQTANAATEGQYATRTLSDRVDKMFYDVSQAANTAETSGLQKLLKRMEYSAVLNLAAKESFASSGTPMEYTKEEMAYQLDPRRADPRVWPEYQVALAQAKGLGIANEFDQLILDYERDYGQLLKGLGAAGGIVRTGLDAIRGMRAPAPRTTVLRVGAR